MFESNPIRISLLEPVASALDSLSSGIAKRLLLIGVGLIAGHFAFQALFDGNWAVATERSVFTGVAAAVCASSARRYLKDVAGTLRRRAIDGTR